ncbi:MAG: Fe-S cluster assembly protein SufD [Dehalococcoidia bacterium]
MINELTAEASKALGESYGDSPRLAELRTAGMAAAERLEMPAPIQRPWKYLDVTNFDMGRYHPATTTPSRADASALSREYGILDPVAGALFQVDGTTVASTVVADGLSLADVAEAGGELRGLIDTRLADALAPDRDRFAAVHYAFLRGGVAVHAAANAEIAEPAWIVRDYREAGQLATPHTLIVTGANSRLTVVEDFRSNEAEILAVPIAEIFVGEGSVVRYITLHRWGAQTRVFGGQKAITERDAEFAGMAMVTGGLIVKEHVESAISGRGSGSELYAVVAGNGKQHIDFDTLQDHIGRDTRSDLLFKSALADQSRSVYYGVTMVRHEARGADANQENRNLLLSREAKADSDPVLEILTNDVIRCAHGATAGPVDDEQLFYMQSRGLTRAQAVALLVRGFLGEVLDRIPGEALHEYLAGVLEEKLVEMGR